MPDPLSPELAYRQLAGHPGWVVERSRIYRDLRFDSFSHAMAFLNRVAEVAEREQHHPNLALHEWSHVHIELYTHLLNGISQRDVDLAVAIDAVVDAG